MRTYNKQLMQFFPGYCFFQFSKTESKLALNVGAITKRSQESLIQKIHLYISNLQHVYLPMVT